MNGAAGSPAIYEERKQAGRKTASVSVNRPTCRGPPPVLGRLRFFRYVIPFSL